ncbi:hypothetical protein JZ785_02350 [Alicyclobacillus curvatus]|nr:hypothetical protein JZ785_02350 [Alicyclobacillus curvatus]
MPNQALEDEVRRVRKEGQLHVSTKTEALEIVEYAKKTYGYLFSITRTSLGYLVVDED